jgi:heme A synthase
MAPPLFFLLFVALVLIVVAVGAFVAIRTGLWVRETSPDGDTAESDGAESGERFDRRPEHTRVDDPGKQTFIGT